MSKNPTLRSLCFYHGMRYVEAHGWMREHFRQRRGICVLYACRMVWYYPAWKLLLILHQRFLIQTLPITYGDGTSALISKGARMLKLRRP